MLNQADRIFISKKLISIDKENESIAESIAMIEDQEQAVIQNDNANKSLFSPINDLITRYEREIERLAGNGRNSLLEQDLIDSALMKLGNYFAPNDQNNKAPSLSDGVWKNFIPYARNIAVGKEYNETYEVVENELVLINNIITKLNNLQNNFQNIELATGQSCATGGVCSLPSYNNPGDCASNGGVWNGSDIISDNPTIHADAQGILTDVNYLIDFIINTKDLIVTDDSDITRQNQNDAMINSTNSTVVSLNNWAALPDFSTNHGQTTCAGFYNYPPNNLPVSKFRYDQLFVLLSILQNRLLNVNNRDNVVQDFLGTVIQSLIDGSVVMTSGLYGNRFNIINLRLNLLGGSLRQVYGISKGIDAQQQAILANENAKNVYSSVMVASAFKAPSQGHKKIHLTNSTGIFPGDIVYVTSDTQMEISTSVVSVSDDMVELNNAIPKKYRQSEGARLYKVL